MTHPSDSADKMRNVLTSARGAPETVNADTVKAYLAEHPEILRDEPDLLAKIVPESERGDTPVLDFQLFTIEKLRQEIEDLRELQQAMVNAAEENAVARDQVFGAVLKILDARNFEHLIHYVTTELAQDIEVDLVSLGVEASGSTKGLAGMRTSSAAGAPTVMVLEEGMVDALIGFRPDGEPRDHALRDDVEGARELFGVHSVQVQSEALIRLRFSRAAPPGVLALGSTRANQFYPEQAIDHLDFLARVIERSVRLWLDLPPA